MFQTKGTALMTSSSAMWKSDTNSSSASNFGEVLRNLAEGWQLKDAMCVVCNIHAPMTGVFDKWVAPGARVTVKLIVFVSVSIMAGKKAQRGWCASSNTKHGAEHSNLHVFQPSEISYKK